MNVIKSLIAIFVGSTFLVTLAGCNTVEGAGKDVKAAGAGVEKEAKENKTY
jgi:predicted small secreted protein